MNQTHDEIEKAVEHLKPYTDKNDDLTYRKYLNVLVALAQSYLSGDLFASEGEIGNIIYEEIIRASGDGIAKPSQYVKNCVKALSYRIAKPQLISEYKDKLFIANGTDEIAKLNPPEDAKPTIGREELMRIISDFPMNVINKFALGITVGDKLPSETVELLATAILKRLHE